MRNPSDPFFDYYKWLHVFLFIFSNDHLYGYEIFSPIELGFYWLIIPIHFATHVPLILCCKTLYPLVFVEDFFLALWHGSAFWSSFSGFFFFKDYIILIFLGKKITLLPTMLYVIVHVACDLWRIGWFNSWIDWE